MIKPILFSTPMVQAILDGRKTMTRRVVTPQPRLENSYLGGQVTSSTDTKLMGCVGFCRSALAVTDHDYARPKYQPGDILWVRETWARTGIDCPLIDDDDSGSILYKATDKLIGGAVSRWRPSIFMPKEAARIWLRVTDVRCERVRDITEDDCRKEGLDTFNLKRAFSELWDWINAKRGYSWDSNPWVWVISFERIDKEGSEK